MPGRRAPWHTKANNNVSNLTKSMRTHTWDETTRTATDNRICQKPFSLDVVLTKIFQVPCITTVIEIRKYYALPTHKRNMKKGNKKLGTLTIFPTTLLHLATRPRPPKSRFPKYCDYVTGHRYCLLSRIFYGKPLYGILFHPIRYERALLA